MTYRVSVDDRIKAIVAELPTEAAELLIEVWSLLALAPWSGRPFVRSNPEGPFREVDFGDGRGAVSYVVVEHSREVDVVDILWAG